MPEDGNATIQAMARVRVATWVVAVLAVAVCVYALYLVVVGVAVTVSSGEVTIVEREPGIGAVIPLIGGIAALVGVWRSESRWMTGGGLTVLIFGILYIFGAGLYFAMLGVALFAAALISSDLMRRESGRGEVTS